MTETIYYRVINGIETYTPEEADSDDTKMLGVDLLADELAAMQKQMAEQIARAAGIDMAAVDLSNIDAVATTRQIIASQAENGEPVEVTFENAEKVARLWKATTHSSAQNGRANRVLARGLLAQEPAPLTDKDVAAGKYADAHEKHVRRIKKATMIGWPELEKLCRNEDGDLISTTSNLRAIKDILKANKEVSEERNRKAEANKAAAKK